MILMETTKNARRNEFRDVARYRKEAKITWDCETPLYSQIHDKYLLDKDEIIEEIRIDVETLCAIAIELIKHAAPGVVREAGRIIEIRSYKDRIK